LLNEKLKEYLFQCDMHLKRMNFAKNQINFPLRYKTYDLLGEEDFAHLDQMVFRFTKLQDTLGNKVFPLILEILGEEVKKMSFIDRLNRLEELEFLDAENWLKLREIRNNATHEYFSNMYLIVDNLNTIYKASFELENIYNQIKSKLGEKNV